MPVATDKEAFSVKVLGFVLEGSASIIFNSYLILWRLFKHNLLKLKDSRIIYGQTYASRQIFDYPKGRNQHTYIKGLTGFGKSSLATNLAIQNIEKETAGIFLDPHGNPFAPDDEKGAIVEIFERVRRVDKLVFLSLNQKKKVIGYNPLFALGSFLKLDRLKDDLLNSIFFDARSSINGSYEVINAAELILESVVYFHAAYFEWLLREKKKDSGTVKNIISSRQLTINDLAHLDNNPALISLFIHILGYKGSKYYRPDLVRRWEKVQAKKTLEAGFKGVAGRLRKMVSTSKSRLFFESCGFNLLQERRKGKFVLCDLSGLDAFTTGIICKLILVRIFTYQMNRVFPGQTEFYIDEAANAEIPNLPQIIAQGRKRKLALTLIFQYTRQFKNPDIINAVCKGIVTRINFRNNEPDLTTSLEVLSRLKKQEFCFENSWRKFEKVRTSNMPPRKRKVELEARGLEVKELRERIAAKRSDLMAYFLQV